MLSLAPEAQESRLTGAKVCDLFLGLATKNLCTKPCSETAECDLRLALSRMRDVVIACAPCLGGYHPLRRTPKAAVSEVGCGGNWASDHDATQSHKCGRLRHTAKHGADVADGKTILVPM